MLVISEYIEGVNLENFLKNKVQFSLKMKICRQIVSGMNWLHNSNLIFYNFNKSNVLIDKDNNVKISDFGFYETKKKLRNTHLQEFAFLYLAPEILMKQDVDNKCDVYRFYFIFFNFFNFLFNLVLV